MNNEHNLFTDTAINMTDIVGRGGGDITHLPEVESYESVYQIQTNDYIIGGANGTANLQARQLVARDNYLKKKLETIERKVNELDEMAGNDSDTTSFYTAIMQELKSLDVSVFKRQISQLEHQNLANAIEMKKVGIAVDEDDMIIEVFQNGTISSLDQTNIEVTGVIKGDDSVDIADIRNLIKGGVYLLSDGETSEEVKIAENLGATANGYRILFAEEVKNDYNNGKARLYRSSVKTVEGKAYGGGVLRTQTWNADIDFAGATGESTISAEIDFSNGLGFELDGAVVDADGQIVIGEEAVGVALTPSGWVRIDAEGDDLNVSV